LLTELHELEPSDGQWLERRAQCLVDLKRFEDADRGLRRRGRLLYEPEYKSLGLLSNRALAYEGLSDWTSALRDYDEVVRLSSAVDRAPPYVLNSRGNVLSSLGRYEDALESYRLSAETFQKSRNLSGAIYARSNAALMLAELGREDDAMSEFEAVARRAGGLHRRARRAGGDAVEPGGGG
jgi:tetratricopeptide (TPR) repeat protein